MSKVNYTLVFNRKSEKLEPDETALIQIIAYQYLNNKPHRKYISTGIRVRESQWKEGKIIRHLNQVKLNLALRNKVSELEDYELSVTNSKKQFTLDMFDRFLKGYLEMSFIEFVRYGTGRDTKLRHSTKKQHLVLASMLEEYDRIVEFSDLTYEKIKAFDDWLRIGGRKQSTIHGYHKRMKVHIRKAIVEGIFYGENPYERFKTEVGNIADRKYLYPEDLKKLQERELHIPRLDHVRDLFLFSCYTGMAYSDAEKLTEENIVQINGERWIKIYRTKTDTRVSVPILPPAERILAKYRGVRAGRLLPVISNQKTNAFLKEIATLCDIRINLTTHVARHTFATTVTLMHGVPVEVVQVMLGHKKIATTQIYAKILDNRIAEEMRKVRDRL